MKIWKNRKMKKRKRGGAHALRVSRTVTRLTVNRSLQYARSSQRNQDGRPKNDAPPPQNDRGNDVLLDDIEKCSQVPLLHAS